MPFHRLTAILDNKGSGKRTVLLSTSVARARSVSSSLWQRARTEGTACLTQTVKAACSRRRGLLGSPRSCTKRLTTAGLSGVSCWWSQCGHTRSFHRGAHRAHPFRGEGFQNRITAGTRSAGGSTESRAAQRNTSPSENPGNSSVCSSSTVAGSSWIDAVTLSRCLNCTNWCKYAPAIASRTMGRIALR